MIFRQLIWGGKGGKVKSHGEEELGRDCRYNNIIIVQVMWTNRRDGSPRMGDYEPSCGAIFGGLELKIRGVSCGRKAGSE